MQVPEYNALKTHPIKVLVFSSLPFNKLLYKGGYFKAVSLSTSSSNTRQNTGNIVNTVVYPSNKLELKIGRDTK